MPSTFFGLEIARRGLMANKTGLDVTGHNVTNSGTEGYSRQTAVLGTTPSLFQPSMHRASYAGQIGTGVNVDQIKRYRDSFLDMQYRNENRALGYWGVQSDTLVKIQSILSEETNTGLSQVMDQFWQGWEDLTAHPEQPAARGVVVERGKAVAETFSHISRQVTQLETDLNDKLMSTVDTINSYSGQIADLNNQIQAIEVSGDKANDLRDKRDLLLDKLSSLIDITVSEDKSGMVSVGGGNGTLVSGGSTKKLMVVDSPDANGKSLYELKWDSGMVALPNSGALRGILESRGTMVPAGYSSRFGSDNFDWQAKVSNPSAAQVVDVTASTVVGTYKLNITSAGTNAALPAMTYTAPSTGHSETYKITGTDGALCQFQVASSDTIDDVAAKFNALTSHTGVTATVSGTTIQLTAVDAGSKTFKLDRYDDAATPALISSNSSAGGSNVVISSPVTLDVGGGVTQSVAVSSVSGNQVTLANGLVLNLNGASGSNVDVQISKREGMIADIRRKLNKMATVFSAELNKKHMEGVSLEDIKKSPNKVLGPSGIRFFVDATAYQTNSTYVDPTNMENMIVNPLLDNSSKIAAARSDISKTPPPTTAIPYEGNSDNSLQLSQLKYKKLDEFPQPSTVDDYYRTVSGDLGVSGQQADRMEKNQTTLTDLVRNQRDSVSSVSLDDEITNMIRYQQAYNASARMINAVDEMLDKMINLGVVGR
ncbi:flagellar hook-associated protein FlgK [Heliobacterium gestii]|uniref:Flagellar hook-associated protein 1 n=1 Tax=Heliomicrobium gestii TaxID=2699 RepID=A0A845LF33_HELGE|nr:flagellar hook-associated protein FlgK [Heliomicrobium gestii]MBM7866665.1 flagellar hook-associated protein 1 FlgK [Heliomicrobium gestii]MZP43055.1 flagellar hook-associated protein FlgK [Heliomicrobium gestii]